MNAPQIIPHLMRPVIIFALIFAPTLPLHAESTKEPAPPMAPEFLYRTIVENLTSYSQLEFMLTLAKASTEDIREVLKEAKSRVKAPPARNVVKLANGNVMVNGKNSGMSVTSFTPVKIAYKGKSWSYDSHTSLAANQKSLLSLLPKANSTAATSLLLPVAHANATFETMLGYVFITNMSAGLLLGLLGMTGWGGALLLLATLVGSGYLGAQKGHQDDLDQKRRFDELLRHEITVTCDADSASISVKGQITEFPLLKVTRKSRGPTVLRTRVVAYDDKGVNIFSSNFGELAAEKASQLMTCTSPTEATALEAQWNAARLAVSGAASSPGNPATSTVPGAEQ